jgi:hypothetical protein
MDGSGDRALRKNAEAWGKVKAGLDGHVRRPETGRRTRRTTTRRIIEAQ